MVTETVMALVFIGQVSALSLVPLLAFCSSTPSAGRQAMTAQISL